MKICLIEACDDNDRGSIGVFYVKYWVEQAGYQVDMLNNTQNGYDIEMISVHHCMDFLRVAKIKKRAKIRLIGGHPMQNNPRPIIPYADAVFIGEAESHIGPAIKTIEEQGLDGLQSMPGWIISKNWRTGNSIPATQIEDPLPPNPPYLNRPGTRSAAWYVEIARGCPYSCNYCELGHSTKYRTYKKEQIKKTLGLCDLTKTKKINFYAPDEAAHPAYNELFCFLQQQGFSSTFSSMRIESVMAKKPPVKKNVLIRIGIDGLTENTRKKVNKPITNRMIYEYFKYWIDRGHVNFKMFMMFGYSWEMPTDFNEFEWMMKTLFAIQLKKNIMLRIKWTPFIPQPCTPLGKEIPKYDYDIVKKILIFHDRYKIPVREPGFFIDNDGLMSGNSHRLACTLTNGDEFILQKITKEKPLWKISR